MQASLGRSEGHGGNAELAPEVCASDNPGTTTGEAQSVGVAHSDLPLIYHLAITPQVQQIAAIGTFCPQMQTAKLLFVQQQMNADHSFRHSIQSWVLLHEGFLLEYTGC